MICKKCQNSDSSKTEDSMIICDKYSFSFPFIYFPEIFFTIPSYFSRCKGCWHQDCFPGKLPESRRRIQPFGRWFCRDCFTHSKINVDNVCSLCSGMESASKFGNGVTCAGCDRFYHLFCLVDPLDAMPECPWFCSEKCQEIAFAACELCGGKQDEEKILMCDTCDKGVFFSFKFVFFFFLFYS